MPRHTIPPALPVIPEGSDSDGPSLNPEFFEVLARQWVRAVRGRRSQKGFSRLIGYRSNIAQRWESGACWPTASGFLSACAIVKPHSVNCFTEFFKRRPAWFSGHSPFAPSSIAAFLRDVRGKTPIGVLAARSGYNRYSVGRWLGGVAHPKLPEFLCVVEAASRRSLDFVATIVDPSALPSVALRWAELQSAREAAYEHPWSHAVLRALELESVARGRSATHQRLATTLGLAESEVASALEVLERTGQIRKVRGRWRLARVMAIDTSRDDERAKALKGAWTQIALDRLRSGAPGSFGYSLFAVSQRDLRRLREIHLEYVRAMQDVIYASRPSECVGLYCSQLLDLNVMDNALSEPGKTSKKG